MSDVNPPGRGLAWPDRGWAPAAVGRRVSVRRVTGETGPSGGPAFRDVVGVLVGVTGDSGNIWSVRRRSGEIVTVDADQVVAAKVVPEIPATRRSASDIDAGTLERIAARAWQPLQQEQLGEWTLRAAKGYTGRANSVLPLGDPGRPLTEALAAIRDWYDARSLPAKIQVPLPLCRQLDVGLADLEWVSGAAVSVMVADLDPLRMARGTTTTDGVTVTTSPDPAWLAAFRYGDRPVPVDVVPIMTKAAQPLFASVRAPDGNLLAIGRGAIEGRWLGLTALEVAEGHRRRGLGRQLIGALAEKAAAQRCRHVWLQVAEDNEPAQSLYRTLGFVEHHHYVYRELPPTRR